MNRETRKRLERDVLDSSHARVSLTIICPFCQYDHDEERKALMMCSTMWEPAVSMSVTREEDGLLYNCFRAGCKDGRGFISLVDQLHTKPKAKEFTPKQYKYRTVNAKQKYLEKHIQLTQEEIDRNGIKYSIDRDTYVFPIYHVGGHEVGLVDRSYNGRTPKTINYMFNEGQHLAYPKKMYAQAYIEYPKNNIVRVRPGEFIKHNDVGGRTYSTLYARQGIMLVEDIPSAIIGNRYVQTVSLLGTHLNDERVRELRRRTKHLLIALDPDATDKAIGYAKKYSIFFDSIEVLLFPKDVKDCTDKEIREVLEI